MRRIPLVLLCVAVTSCGQAVAPEADPTPAIPAVERIGTIGCVACEDVESIVPVALDVVGDRVFLRDEYEPLIRVFNLAGNLQFTFGKFGEGPGELSPFATPVFSTADGQLLAYGLTKLQLFDQEGQYVEAYDWPPRIPMAHQYNAGLNRLFVLTAPMGASGIDLEAMEVVAYNPGAAEFGPHVVVPGAGIPMADTEDGRRPLVGAMAVRGDGQIVLADDENYRMYWYTPDGEPAGEFGRDLPRPSLTPREIERDEEIRVSTGSTQPLLEAAPHFGGAGLFFDGADRLWVQTRRWSGEGMDRTETIFDVFDPEGAYLGEVLVPVPLSSTRYPVLTVRGDTMVGGYLDDALEWTVGIWRIVG
ncbi:MAG: hypothetical protein GKS06_08680 [Acidobacteria bacterium]|nr:hypothetical protein [Acidobacteriota bacterium]